MKKNNSFKIQIWMTIGVTFFIGIIIGGALSHIQLLNGFYQPIDPPGQIIDPIECKLYRFELLPEKRPVYQQWIDWHHQEYSAMIKTLPREKMYLESVFRDTINEPNTIYWLTFNGRGGEPSSTSNLEIDKKHNTYRKEILKKGSRSVLKTEFLLTPSFIERAIAREQHERK
jgi:hypothetical protein